MADRGISQINKLPSLVALTFCIAAVTQAQQSTCHLKLDQLADIPELHGFHLGMTAEEAKAKEALIRFGRPDNLGVMKTSINPAFDRRFDQVAFSGVRTISLDFLDNQLATLWIGYDDTFKWHSVDEFIDGISKSLKLPKAWELKRGGQLLACDGFSIFVSAIAGSPSIRLTDEAAQETIASRREEAAAAAEAAKLAVVGDQRTKLYYPSDCEALQTVTEPNRLMFKDKDEAEKAGYKLAKDCQ